MYEKYWKHKDNRTPSTVAGFWTSTVSFNSEKEGYFWIRIIHLGSLAGHEMLDQCWIQYTQYTLNFNENMLNIVNAERKSQEAVSFEVSPCAASSLARVGDVTVWVPSHCIACGALSAPELQQQKIPWFERRSLGTLVVAS